MKSIIMDDKYKLGIKIIDEQHQKIFDLIGKLCDNITSGDLLRIIQELKDYSLYHFQTEEEYFDSIDFKYSTEHKILHNNFDQTIDFYFVNPDTLNKKKIHTFLTVWIENHILVEDQKYTLKENINN